MNKQSTKNQMLSFLKKYGYIFAVSAVLLSLAIVLSFVVNNNDEGTTPVDTNPITFYSPILNATVAKGYSDSSLVYNTTLKQWEAHKAVTFTVPTNSDVYAALDGVVKEIYNNYLDGTVIVLEHANKLSTVYGSLAENVEVKVGDLVRRGDVIGKASSTAHQEHELGNHLRFELLEDGVKIDPSNYLNLENK